MKEDNNTFVYINKEELILKDYLSTVKGYSSRLLRFIKREGIILVNQKPARMDKALTPGDIIIVKMPIEEIDAPAQKLDLDIIYEDLDLIVVSKKPLMVTHPTRSHQENNLANGIAYHFNKNRVKAKIRFVNRLDRDTTGLVVIAKSKFAHQHLQSQMKEGLIKKTYFAVVHGCISNKKGTIDLPIGRLSEETFERCVMEEGKRSITRYEVLKSDGAYSLVKLELETGRTHQIRVHMKAIGHPLAGDPLYNPENEDSIKRQALHSGEMEFMQPRSGEKIKVSADIPEDMRILCEQI
ncbi:MAG TPA: RluA family pseudouridine synthase [Eubacteriaceae bacterium]|jgi:23S rRNA pseudouridine1911/1915/1917 synthase|nr:RluA family pseudouridine synthase [Eubacteriaceae bacterium]